jgi:hypothetical protein
MSTGYFMRAIHSATKAVLHVPLGIAATSIGMAASVVIAASSPHPATQSEPQITAREITPKTVESIPAETIADTLANLSLPKGDRLKDAVRPVTPPETDEVDVPADSERARPTETEQLDAKDSEAEPIDTAADARAYLAKTALPGGTMVMLGREKSVECFNPQFAINLAATIRDARKHGFSDASVLSGCRPPRLGIGGFKDKKNSLHGVGLAADLHGVGTPCSESAKRFHAIAASHGVLGVYGHCNRAEWNHFQGTAIKMTSPELRESFTAAGDIAPNLERLWLVEAPVVFDVAMPVSLGSVVADNSRWSGRSHVSGRSHGSGRAHFSRRHGKKRHLAGHEHRHKYQRYARRGPSA